MESNSLIIEETALLKEAAKDLCDWYVVHKRSMPWRDQPDAYRIWVSEIMLQQTRIEAAMPYYERFVTELPNVEALAACSQERLLKLWEGLGYYSRVRNMQACAQKLCEEFEARLPANEEQLKKLPGIGPYTAGAIGSIAFELPIPAVDGNVMRVISRLLRKREDVMSTKARRYVENLLREVLPTVVPSDLNQGLMELGETICIPGNPDCENCPIVGHCQAREAGEETQLPVRIVKTKRRIEERTILLLTDGERCVIRRRPDTGLLAGLFEYPGVERTCSPEELIALLKDRDVHVLDLAEAGSAKHIFSHIEWRMKGFEVSVERAELERLAGVDDLFLADARELEETYALPTAFGAYTKYLKRRLYS